METYMISGFSEILREIPKIFNKNGKLMISLILLYLSFISLFYWSAVASTKPFLTNLIVKVSLIPVTNPKTREFAYLLIDLKNAIRDFVVIEWINIININVTYLYFVTATITASALMHGGKNMSCRELLLSTQNSLKRPFLTWFYIALFGCGYVLFFLANLLPMALIIQQPVAVKTSAIVLTILAAILYCYLAVIWTLALVMSVLEDKSGLEALGKAAQIVNGMQLQGFVLNLLLTASTFVILLAMRIMVNTKLSPTLAIITGLVAVNFSCLVNIFWLMAYTVLYYHCKKLYGEEVKLQGIIVYRIVPTSPFLNESIQ